MYVPYDDFIRLYPYDEKTGFLGGGVYGSVYTSGENAIKVVKGFKETINESFIREVDLYSSIDHPCIGKIKAWSFDLTTLTGYLILPQGINSKDAIRKRLISLEEIMADMVSALEYLYYLGIVHLDVKPENIIYHKNPGETRGRAILIDFGLAQRSVLGSAKADPRTPLGVLGGAKADPGTPLGVLASNGRRIVRGVGYTYPYRYPEYNFEQWNPVEVEFYALAKTLFAYYPDIVLSNIMERIYTFRTGAPKIDALIQLVTVRKNLIPSTPEIVAKLDLVRRWIGVRRFTERIVLDVNCSRWMSIVSQWLVELGISRELMAKTVFLALHLMHRTVTSIVPGPKNTFEYRLFALSCLILANTVEADKIIKTTSWVKLTGSTFSSSQINEMIIKIMISARGIIQTHTYWDAAESVEDLELLLNDMINCNYTGETIRSLTGIKNNKDVPIEFFKGKSLIRSEEEMHFPVGVVRMFETKEKTWIPTFGYFFPMERPVYPLDKPLLDWYDVIIRELAQKRHDSFTNVMPVIMENLDNFAILDTRKSKTLYNWLKAYINRGSWDILTMTTRFNFERVTVLDIPDLNPFTAKCDQIKNGCPAVGLTFFMPKSTVLVSVGTQGFTGLSLKRDTSPSREPLKLPSRYRTPEESPEEEII